MYACDPVESMVEIQTNSAATALCCSAESKIGDPEVVREASVVVGQGSRGVGCVVQCSSTEASIASETGKDQLARAEMPS